MNVNKKKSFDLFFFAVLFGNSDMYNSAISTVTYIFFFFFGLCCFQPLISLLKNLVLKIINLLCLLLTVELQKKFQFNMIEWSFKKTQFWYFSLIFMQNFIFLVNTAGLLLGSSWMSIADRKKNSFLSDRIYPFCKRNKTTPQG